MRARSRSGEISSSSTIASSHHATMMVKTDRALRLTQDLVLKICAVKVEDTADAEPLFTRMLQRMLNAEKAIGPRAFDGGHQCTLIPKIPGIPANPEVTAGWKLLNGSPRLTGTLEMREVIVDPEVTVE